MTIPRYAYKIAAGANNAAGLVNIESLVPSGGTAFYPPEGYGGYNPGQFRIRADGTVYIAGFASTVWRFKKLTRKQYDYLRSTYCGSSYSGNVTIATRTGADSYSNLTGVLILPIPADMERHFTVWQNVDLRFVRLTTAS